MGSSPLEQEKQLTFVNQSREQCLNRMMRKMRDLERVSWSAWKVYSNIEKRCQCYRYQERQRSLNIFKLIFCLSMCLQGIRMDKYKKMS
jgi:hypothetical protein